MYIRGNLNEENIINIAIIQIQFYLPRVVVPVYDVEVDVDVVVIQ